jgi:DNA-binding SARP family transcriptional activator
MSGTWTVSRLGRWVEEPRALVERLTSIKHLHHGEIRVLAQTLTQRLDVLTPEEAGILSPLDDKIPAVRIRTLGPFGIEVHNRPLELSRHTPRKPLELLMVLIAHGGRMVRRERLCDDLWPDADGATAQQSFDVTLHRLRKVLGVADAIQSRNGQVSLNEAVCWLDIWAFEAMVDALRHDASPAGDETGLLEIDRWLKVYRGMFLRERVDPWVMPPRERLRGQFIRVVRSLAGSGDSRQALEQAARIYERAIEVAPLAEELYRRLMACNAALGRAAEALAVFRRCQQALWAYQGVEPGEETRALYRSLLGRM